MEDVQSTSLTPPTNGGNILQTNMNMDTTTTPAATSTTGGLNVSMHAPQPPSNSVKGKSKVTDNDAMQQDKPNSASSSSSSQQWKTVTKQRNFRIAIPLVHLPGETDIDKKNYAYNMINKFPELTSINIMKIKDSKVVAASFFSEAAAKQACLEKISSENDKCFAPFNEVTSAQPSTTFFVKVIDVPLDIDKPVFQQFLNKFGYQISN